jgi:tripartite-type tricarboxylate transporter receptor subunit TctC
VEAPTSLFKDPTLAVRADSPWKSPAEFLDDARANPHFNPSLRRSSKCEAEKKTCLLPLKI